MAVQHQIDLEKMDNGQNNSAPYGSVPRIKEFKIQEKYRMLGKDVVEPTQMVLASPVVFFPKKTELLTFASSSAGWTY